MAMQTTLGAFPLVRILFSKINRSFVQIHSAFSSKFVTESSRTVNCLKYISKNPSLRMWETVSFTSDTVLSYLHMKGELL